MCRAIHEGGRRCPGGHGASPAATARAARAEALEAKRANRRARSTRYKEQQLRQADDAQSFITTTRDLGLADRAVALEQHLARVGKQQGSHRAERAVLSAELASVQGAISEQKRAEFLRAMGIDPTLSNADVTRIVYHRAGLPQPSDEHLTAVYRDGVQDADGTLNPQVDRDGAPLPTFDAPPERIEKSKPKRRTKALDKAEERLADLERMGASPESIAVARRRVEVLTPEPGQPAPKLPSKPLAKARKAVADAVAAGADQSAIDALQRKADKLKPKVHPVIDDPAAPVVAQVPKDAQSVNGAGQSAVPADPGTTKQGDHTVQPVRVPPSASVNPATSPDPWRALREQANPQPAPAPPPAPSVASPPSPRSVSSVNVAGLPAAQPTHGVNVAGQSASPAPRLAPTRPGEGMARTRARVYADGTVVSADDLATIDDARGFAAREQAEVDAIEHSPRRAVDESKMPEAVAQVEAVIAAERAKGATDEQLQRMLSDAVLGMRRSDSPELHEAFLGAMRSLEWR